MEIFTTAFSYTTGILAGVLAIGLVIFCALALIGKFFGKK